MRPVGLLGDNMKSAIVFFVATIAVGTAFAQTYVRPHVTKNGTYVEGHVRTAPNSTNLDNYGTKGNTNPYTGQAGTVQPNYAPQPVYQQPAQPSYGQPRCGIASNGQYVCH